MDVIHFPIPGKRVVIDTEIFVFSLLTNGLARYIIDLWFNQRFTLLVSSEIMEEIEDVLKRPLFRKYNISLERISLTLDALKDNAEYIDINEHPYLTSRDPNDNKILFCALSGNADYLVTEDKDLLVMKDMLDLNGTIITRMIDFINYFQ